MAHPAPKNQASLIRLARLRDLSGVVADIAGNDVLPESLAKLRGDRPDSLPRVDGTPRLGACVGGVGKFVCIGLNYSDHAAESGMAVPNEPVIFMKATSCISDRTTTS